MTRRATSAGPYPEVPLNLRKAPREADAPPQLFQVLATQDAQVGDGQLMGSAQTYVMPGAGAGAVAGAIPGSKRGGGAAAAAVGGGNDAEISLNPEDLEAGLDDAEVAARYEAQINAQRAAAAPEDFSDMVADNAMRSKRKADAKKKESDAKKFKF